MLGRCPRIGRSRPGWSARRRGGRGRGRPWLIWACGGTGCSRARGLRGSASGLFLIGNLRETEKMPSPLVLSGV